MALPPKSGASHEISGGQLRGLRAQVRDDQDEEIGHTRLGATSCPIPSNPKGNEGEVFIRRRNVMWNFLKTGPSSCPIIHGMLSLFATRQGPVWHCALPDIRNLIAWNTDRRRVYAVMGMSRPSPPGRVRAHWTFGAESNWLPQSPKFEPASRTLPDSASTRRCAPVVPAECATPYDGFRSRQRTPVPSGSNEALAQYSISLDEPACVHLLVTSIKIFRAKCKTP